MIMKPLIRPFLFAVARLGLFLAVMAWIVGQWWTIYSAIPAGHGLVEIYVGDKSYEVSRWDVLPSTSFNITADRRADSLPFEVLYTLFRGELRSDSCGQALLYVGPGFFTAKQGVIDGMSIRHWLIITIFALFYGVLKWVYRKRGTEVADGE